MGDVRNVLDSSALLALLQGEPGWEEVASLMEYSVISSVNWSEVAQKTLAKGGDILFTRQGVEALGLTLLPFTSADAELAAQIWPQTKPLGLSFGDRACLAVALKLNLPALTTDQVWKRLELNVPVQVIR